MPDQTPESDPKEPSAAAKKLVAGCLGDDELLLNPKETAAAVFRELSEADDHPEEEADGGPKVNPAEEKDKLVVDKAKSLAWIEVALGRLNVAALGSDIAAREKYANRLFCLMVCWLSAILLIILLVGFLSKRDALVNFWVGAVEWKLSIHFELSDSIVLALIGGTTASVIGLFVFVAKYLFPAKDGHAKEEKKAEAPKAVTKD